MTTDIKKSSHGKKTVFTASSAIGIDWMKKHLFSKKAELSPESAHWFKKQAEDAGLKVRGGGDPKSK
jgi:hypothetical protein